MSCRFLRHAGFSANSSSAVPWLPLLDVATTLAAVIVALRSLPDDLPRPNHAEIGDVIFSRREAYGLPGEGVEINVKLGRPDDPRLGYQY